MLMKNALSLVGAVAVTTCLCFGATYVMCLGVMAGFDALIGVVEMLPKPAPYVPQPEPVEEEAEEVGEPVFQGLIKMMPKTRPPPFHAPRFQSPPRNWPPGFYADPEPDPPAASPEPTPYFMDNAPASDLECPSQVLVTKGGAMKWFCLEGDAPEPPEEPVVDDAPPTIESFFFGPSYPTYCVWRYCPSINSEGLL